MIPSKELTSGGAPEILQRMSELTGDRPALKLDVSSDELTLTYLGEDSRPHALRWQNGTIKAVDSDVQYLDQATFRTTDYPLAKVGELFRVAESLGSTGSEKVLQIVQYRSGEVYMSVATTPETKTVFFTKDGDLIRTLGFRSVSDIGTGIKDVVGGARDVVQVGFNTDDGYWADLPPTSGVTERRARTGALPVFVTRRGESTDRPSFDPTKIDALVLAHVIENSLPDPDKACRIEIDSRFKKVAPTIRFDCDGKIIWTDLSGTKYTEAELNKVS